jgi:hypothetical protein
VAGGAGAARAVLARMDPADLAPDTAARLPGWLEVHGRHLEVLGEPAPAALPGGSPQASVPDTLRASDPARAAADQLRAFGDSAVRSTGEAVALHRPPAENGASRDATRPGSATHGSPAQGPPSPGAPTEGPVGDATTATLYARIAAARWAQERLLRSALDLPQRDVLWPEGTPVATLQQVLAAEHAVVDGYRTASAWATGRRDEFVAATIGHEDARDDLVRLISAAGQVPVPAAPGYAMPPEVLPAAPAASDPDTRALTLVLAVEAGLARAVAAVIDGVARTPPETSLVVPVLGAAVWVLSTADLTRQALGAAPDPLPGS